MLAFFQSTCEIVWTPPDDGIGYYGVAVVLEDYLPGDPSNNMSRVPLQFLIRVVKAQLPCEHKPIFINTPQQPYCSAIPEGDTYTLTVTTKHTHPDHRHGTASQLCSV